jgi:AmiR/NasT family two-component response regulator
VLVQETLLRLAAIGLLRAAGATAQGPVLILEPDAEGFTRPLEALLSRRPRALPLHSLDQGEDLPAAFRQRKPSLVILNEVAAGLRMEPAAQAARQLGVPISAVLEAPDRVRAAALVAAGFDAVLVKPIAYSDLEGLLEGKGANAGAVNQGS